MKILTTILRFAAAVILLQTLYFKFSASAESVYIFSTLGLEPVGRIGIGIAELIAAALLISGKFAHWGALLSAGLMAGAMAAHFGPLGYEVMNDNGQLFQLALLVFVCSTVLLWSSKEKFFALANQFRKQV